MPPCHADGLCKSVNSPCQSPCYTSPQYQKSISPPSPSPPSPTSPPSPSSHFSSLSGIKRRETVIIFDWDDTLLASSFLSGKGCRLDSDLTLHPHYNDLQAGLNELDSCVATLLTSALNCGEVHIVTNAETGWVQLSAAKFLPSVIPLLPRIHVVSARSTYECLYPEQPLQWKLMAFQSRLAATWAKLDVSYTDCEKNIISLGDSHVEREAVRTVTKGFVNTRTKSVKFAERPSMEQLRRQIELVTQCFSYIHNHAGDLDLQLTVTVNPQQQPPSVADEQVKTPAPVPTTPTPLSKSSYSTTPSSTSPIEHHQQNASMDYDYSSNNSTDSDDSEEDSNSSCVAGEVGDEEDLMNDPLSNSLIRTQVAA